MKKLNNCPFVHILTAASVCQPKVAFMKTKLTTALTLQWKCQQALVGFTILKLPSQFICGLWLVVPLIMQVNLIGNIRAIAKPVFSGGHCSHAIYRRSLLSPPQSCTEQNIYLISRQKIVFHTCFSFFDLVGIIFQSCFEMCLNNRDTLDSSVFILKRTILENNVSCH